MIPDYDAAGGFHYLSLMLTRLGTIDQSACWMPLIATSELLFLKPNLELVLFLVNEIVILAIFNMGLRALF